MPDTIDVGARSYNLRALNMNPLTTNEKSCHQSTGGRRQISRGSRLCRRDHLYPGILGRQVNNELPLGHRRCLSIEADLEPVVAGRHIWGHCYCPVFRNDLTLTPGGRVAVFAQDWLASSLGQDLPIRSDQAEEKALFRQLAQILPIQTERQPITRCDRWVICVVRTQPIPAQQSRNASVNSPVLFYPVLHVMLDVRTGIDHHIVR